jgi:hypothetical protein
MSSTLSSSQLIPRPRACSPFRLPPEQKLKLDVFFFYRNGPDSTWWNGGTQARTGNKYRYRFQPFTLCWTRFAGVDVQVPCEADDYIRANYGPDYMTPVEVSTIRVGPLTNGAAPLVSGTKAAKLLTVECSRAT